MVENSGFPHSSLNFLHIIHDKSKCSILCIFKQDHVAVPAELDLVEEEDQITHLLRLEEAGNTEDILSKSDFELFGFLHWF